MYGYRDQNNYRTMSSSTLSDIDNLEKTNSEQEKSISSQSELMNSKADINDIINLNDSLNLFVSKQNKINKVLGEGLNTIGDKFNILSNNITNVSEKLSELSIKVSSNTENGNKYDNKIEKLSEKHNEDTAMLNEKISSLNESKENLSNAINSKLSSDDAASIYAKKKDVYTKDEINAFENASDDKFASKDWVLEKKYISSDEADSKYASADSVNKVKDDIEAFKDGMTIQYNGIMQGVIDFQTNTSNRIDTINARLDTFKTMIDKLSDKISKIQG